MKQDIIKAPKLRATVEQRVPTPQEVADDATVEAVAAGAAAAPAAAAAAAAANDAPADNSAPASSSLEAAVAKAAASAAASPPASYTSSSSHRKSPATFTAFYRELDFNGSSFRTMPGGAVGEPVNPPAIPTFPASQLSALDLQAMPSIQP